MDLRETGCEVKDRNEVAQDRVQFQVFVYMIMKLIFRYIYYLYMFGYHL